MAASIPQRRQPTYVRRSFYLAMSISLAAVAVFGFSHTVPGDFAAPGLSPLLQVHAAVFITWVLLFIAQPSFVIRGSIPLHRKFGWFGAVLTVAMVVMGAGAILHALHTDAVPPFYPHGLFLARGFVSIAVFAGLIVAGIVRRRQGEWHKRLMLCAAIQIIVPGLERGLPILLLGSNWPFIADALTVMIALIGPLRDLIVRRRIHPAYYWGVGAIIVGQVLVDLLAQSFLIRNTLSALGTR